MLSNPSQFRNNIKNLIKEKLDLTEDRAKNFEIGLYNHTIKECQRRKIIRKWNNPYFVVLYKDKFRSIWINLFKNSSSDKLKTKNNIQKIKI